MSILKMAVAESFERPTKSLCRRRRVVFRGFEPARDKRPRRFVERKAVIVVERINYDVGNYPTVGVAEDRDFRRLAAIDRREHFLNFLGVELDDRNRAIFAPIIFERPFQRHNL